MNSYARALANWSSPAGRRLAASAAECLRAHGRDVERSARPPSRSRTAIDHRQARHRQRGQCHRWQRQSATGGRSQGEIKDQPHAIAHALQPEMWSKDPERNALLITGDAERTLSDARRTIAGRSEGFWFRRRRPSWNARLIIASIVRLRWERCRPACRLAPGDRRRNGRRSDHNVAE